MPITATHLGKQCQCFDKHLIMQLAHSSFAPMDGHQHGSIPYLIEVKLRLSLDQCAASRVHLTFWHVRKRFRWFKKVTYIGVLIMIGWALTFLIVALIAGVLGFSGIAGAAANIAWILFVVGLILAVIFFIGGRRPRV